MKKSFGRLSYFKRSGATIWNSPLESSKSSSDSAGQRALNELQELCDQKKYKEVLEKLPLIEKNFPSCAKAIVYYRGLAKVEILKENGDLPELSHMKQ